MTGETYRIGFQDGWFYDEEEKNNADYRRGVEDGKKARIKSENIRRKRTFDDKKANQGDES